MRVIQSSISLRLKSIFLSGTGIFIAITVIIALIFATKVFAASDKNVDIIINGECIVTTTAKNTVGGVLEENGIVLNPVDYISVSSDAKLSKEENNVIVIKKAVPVNVIAGGENIVLMTCHETVQAAIMYSPIVMDTDDRFEGVLYSDPVIAGMDIRIVRVEVKTDTATLPIPFEVEYIRNNSLERGVEMILQEGKEGVLEKIERTLFEDGMEVSRETVSETVITPQVNRIVESGTLTTYQTARGGTIKYTDKIAMSSVAYSAVISSADPDNTVYGRTYLGYTARRGIIAVDPNIIPLGSKVYVEVYGSTPDYGYAIAADIGTAIKGYIVDLCFDSYMESVYWGRKAVNVYILADN